MVVVVVIVRCGIASGSGVVCMLQPCFHGPVLLVNCNIRQVPWHFLLFLLPGMWRSVSPGRTRRPLSLTSPWVFSSSFTSS